MPAQSFQPTLDDPHARLGAWLLGAGALGLLATCLCYVLAGPVAALPGGAPAGALGVAAAIAATPLAAGWMRAASLVGVPTDVLLTVGALLLASVEQGRRAAPALAGWLTLALAGALFILVDAMVGLVLPLAAAQAGGGAAYAGLRSLFDALFTIGAATAGAGALALAWHGRGTVFRWPLTGWAMRLAGAVSLLAATGHLVGAPSAAFIGPGIALLALACLGAAAAYAPATLGGPAAARQSA